MDKITNSAFSGLDTRIFYDDERFRIVDVFKNNNKSIEYTLSIVLPRKNIVFFGSKNIYKPTISAIISLKENKPTQYENITFNMSEVNFNSAGKSLERCIATSTFKKLCHNTQYSLSPNTMNSVSEDFLYPQPELNLKDLLLSNELKEGIYISPQDLYNIYSPLFNVLVREKNNKN